MHVPRDKSCLGGHVETVYEAHLLASICSTALSMLVMLRRAAGGNASGPKMCGVRAPKAG